MFDFIQTPTISISDGGVAGDYETAFAPSDPFIDEVINFKTTRVDNALMTPAEVDATWCQTLVNDARNFVEVPDESMNVFPSWKGIHAYDTAGTKGFRTDTWSRGSETNSFDGSVTVRDPDAHGWDNVFWIDLTGDTTGMPADQSVDGNGSLNHRVTSFAQWAAINGTSGNEDRHRWRGGTTHPMAPSGEADRADVTNLSMLRVDTFGGGAAILDFRALTTYFEYLVYRVTSSGARVMLVDIQAIASYDVARGTHNGPAVDLFYCLASLVRVSLVRCRTVNAHRLITGAGTHNERVQGGLFDCYGEGSQDYGLGSIGGDAGFGLRGSRTYYPLTTNRGDTKPGGAVDFSDHATFRTNGPTDLSVAQCHGMVLGGWSTFGLGFAPQPFIRAHTQESLLGTLIVCAWNRVQGRILFSTGHHSSNSTQQTPHIAVVAGNRLDFLSQGLDMITSNSAGGIVAFSNVAYMPDLSNPQAGQGQGRFLSFSEYSSGVASAVWEQPNFLRNNTFLSDRTGAAFSGAQDLLPWENTPGQAGLVLTESGNVMSGDGHTNAASLVASSAFARGEDFRPISGGLADVTVNDGAPISFERIKNDGVTLNGAHQTAGADSSVTPPSATGCTIERLAAYSTTNNEEAYGLVDIAGLVEDGFTAIEWVWELDTGGGYQPFDKTTGGDQERDRYKAVIDMESQTGDLRLTLNLQNPGGKTSVQSNVLTVA